MEGIPWNYYNKTFYNQRGNKLRRNFLQFPSFMSNEELRYSKKKVKNNIANIKYCHNSLQQNNIFQSSRKGDINYKYLQELKRISEEEKKNQLLKQKKFNKKLLNEKIRNKRFLSTISRKELEELNKDAPSNLFDYIHPYEYLFSQRKFKSFNDNEIKNHNDSNQKSVKNLILENHRYKNKKKSELYKNSLITERNKENDKIFINVYKKRPYRINSTNCANVVFEKINDNINLSLSKSQDKYDLKNKSNIFFNKDKIKIQDEEKNTIEHNSNKLTINDYEIYKNSIDNFNNKYNIEYNKNLKTINNREINTIIPSSLKLNLNEDMINDNNINNNNLLINKNFFCKTSRSNSKHKKYTISSENNDVNNKNTDSLDLSEINKFNSRGRLYSSCSINKKYSKNNYELLKEITNIYEKLNNIQASLELKQGDNILEKYNILKDDPRKDMIVLNIIKESNGKVEFEPIHELFKKLEKKQNYINDLSKQYFTQKKNKYESNIRQKFLRHLRKVDLIEKREALFRDLAYKKNYEIRIGINKLKEEDLSKKRKIFNNKTVKIKQMSVNNIENFLKFMKKYN